MNYNRFGLVSFFVFLTVSSSFGQEITVSDDLQPLFDTLKRRSYRHALICNAFTTRFDVLIKSAKNGTRIDAVMQEDYLSDYYKDGVSRADKKKVVGYSADLHDKLALLIAARGSMVGYFGSANFSDNHLNNTELVLRLPNAQAIPGFTRHIDNLFQNADLYPRLRPGHQLPRLSKGPLSSRRERRGSCTGVELISCFDFDLDSESEPEQNEDYDLISWVTDRIKVGEQRNYLISTMTLDHPDLIEPIKQEVFRGGSNFKIVVDRDSMEGYGRDHPVFYLARLAKRYPTKLAICWKKGRREGEASSIHHAKLFVRSPNRQGQNGLSVVSTANFTENGGKQYNSALALPHDSTHISTIQELENLFYVWWRKAEAVPGEPPYIEKPSRPSRRFNGNDEDVDSETDESEGDESGDSEGVDGEFEFEDSESEDDREEDDNVYWRPRSNKRQRIN